MKAELLKQGSQLSYCLFWEAILNFQVFILSSQRLETPMFCSWKDYQKKLFSN